MAVGSAIIAGIGAAYSIYSGERGNVQQRKGIRRQRLAQGQAESRAISETRKAELEQQRAARKANVDVGSILLGEQGKSLPTLLTSQEGTDLRALTLGRKKLLGRSA